MKHETQYIEIDLSYKTFDFAKTLYIDTYYTHSNFYTFKYTFTPMLF